MMRLRAVVWAENRECDDVEEGDRWVTGDVASGAFKAGDEWMSLDCFSRHTKRTSPVSADNCYSKNVDAYITLSGIVQ